MKLTFFLIAFALIFVRVYMSCTGAWPGGRGNVEGNMTIINDNYREEVRWSGDIRLNDDETGIASISPGGYLKYRLNDKKMVAESNLQGEITYSLYDDGNSIAIDSNGRKFITKAVKQLIGAGFDANKRMERIYRAGGAVALLNEIDNLKTDQIKAMYMRRVLADSIEEPDLPLVLKKIGYLVAGNEKEALLNRFTPDKLQDTATLQAFFNVVRTVGPDRDKMNIMTRLIDKGPLTNELFDAIIETTSQFGADWDKVEMYKKLLGQTDITEEQWIAIIDKAAGLNAEMDKASLLVQIAQKMPAGENIRKAYLTAAKTINSDNEYGKVMRAVN